MLTSALCALGGVFAVSWRDAGRDHDAAVRAASVQADLETNLLNQAASIRAYFLDGNTRSFDDYSTARAEAANITAELERLTPRQVSPAIQKVTQAALTWRTTGINPVIATQQRGDTAAALQEYSTGRAASLFSEVTTALNELRASVVGSRRHAAADEHATLVHLGEFAAVAVVLLGLGFALVSWLAHRWFTKPMEEMRGALELGRSSSTFAQEATVLRALRHRVDDTERSAAWDVASVFGPSASRVGGDCIDVVAADDAITIVAVNSLVEGAEAAVACLRVREMIVSGMRADSGESSALAWVARTRADEIAAFKLGALVVRIDCVTGEVAYVNTGGPRAFICDGVATTPLTMLDARTQWTVHPVTVGPGNMFVVATGLADQDAAGVVLGRYGEPAKVIANQLLLAAATADGRREQDVLAVVVCRTPRS